VDVFGIVNRDSEADGKYKEWVRKMRNVTSAPKLQSLPPTSEALAQNMSRAHIILCPGGNLEELSGP
jgi:hypothetical protein